MKATFLGSTPLTFAIRCPCGFKNYFDRKDWQKSNFATCDNCRAIICYSDLQARNPMREVCKPVEELVEGELEELRAIEAEMRGFVEEYYKHPDWLWAPRTRVLVADAEQHLKRLDELRVRPAA